MSDTTAPVIEVYADIWCPFTHVGLRAVADQRAEAGRDDVVIRVRAWPLELVNGAPLDPATTEQHADELREQVAPTLFARLDTDHFPTSTLDALALVERAYRQGPERGERMSFALRDALFEEGRDISDRSVLQDIAADLGVDPPEPSDAAAVLADWESGRDRGVLGSPHFFCGGTDAFCPSLDITKDPDHGLAVTRDTAGLTRFVARCLAVTGDA
jgi:predicted DsbA family dithiol-disulfide isomerase